MRSVTLDGRLNSVGKFVRQGAEFADIGTDHAYLPIYLLKSDRIKSAVASDINEGPLKSAKANAEEMGVSDRMRFVLTEKRPKNSVSSCLRTRWMRQIS